MPTKRYGLSAWAIDGKIYVIGGQENGPYTGANEVFDPSTDSWTTKKPMPTARYAFGSAAIGELIYAVAGEKSGSFTGANEVYNTSSDTWATSTPYPADIASICLAAVNGKLYAIGGHQAPGYQVKDWNKEFNPGNNTWTPMKPMPTARTETSCVVVSGKIYVMGGFQSDPLIKEKIVEIYDPSTNSWSNGTNMTAARSYFAVANLNDNIFVFGGSIPFAIINLTEEFDTTSKEWIPHTNLTFPRARPYAAVINNSIFVLGGATQTDAIRTHEEFQVPLDMDLNIDQSDLTFSDDPIEEGSRLTISVNVTNDGAIDAKDVAVNYYEGHPFGGQDFIKESGVRIDLAHQGVADQFSTAWPDAIRLDNGSYRVFYQGQDAFSGNGRILSSISTDGIDWTSESGYRVDNDRPEYFRLVGAHDVVKLANGSYRIYYFGYNNSEGNIFSGISPDGFNFTKEAGIRIRQGGTYDTTGATSPELIKLNNDTWRMYYIGNGGGGPPKVLSAWSSNGLSFIKEGLRLVPSNVYDSNGLAAPEIIKTSLGHLRMYYVGSDASSNTHILSAVSVDEGTTWVKEPGARLSQGSGGDKDAKGVGSPTFIKLDNGTYRMIYNGGYISGVTIYVILSAVANAPDARFLGQSILDVPASSSNITSFDWDTTGELGNHTIVAVVDPADRYFELDEKNNTAWKDIEVVPFVPGDIFVTTDVQLIEPGETVGINISHPKGPVDLTLKVTDPLATVIVNGSISTNSTGDAFYQFNLSTDAVDGLYTIRVNTSWKNDTTTFDVHNDLPVISSPSDISFMEGTTGHYINWTCSDKNPTNYSILLNGTEIQGGAWNGSNISVSIDGLSSGTYNYTLNLTDLPNNTIFDTVNVTVTPQPVNQLPMISFDSPTNGTQVNGSIAINGTSSDPDGIVTLVEVRIDNGIWSNATGTDNWSFLWNTSKLSGGWYTISARATDINNTSTVASIEVEVIIPVNKVPVMSIDSPSNGSKIKGVVRVNGSAFDQDGVITLVEFRIDNGSWLKAIGTTSWVFEWNTTTYDDGWHRVHTRAIDDDNASVVVFSDIEVDNKVPPPPPPPKNQPPLINITSPKANETVGMAIVIKGDASDPDGDDFMVQIQINDGPWQFVIGGKEWNFNWNTKVEKNGNYTITARVTDEHGAWTEDRLTITVKNKGKPHQIDNGPLYTMVALGSGFSLLGVLVGLGGFLSFTEAGRSKLWMFMLAAGLSKLKKKEVLDDFTRGSIYGTVKRDPGITPREVIMVLDIPEKSFYYHQDVLIKYGYLYRVKMNKFGEVIKKWHGKNGRMTISENFTKEEMDANPKLAKSRLRWTEHYLFASGIRATRRPKLNKRQERVIYKYIRDNPGQNQGQIAKGLQMIRQGLAYYLDQFRKTGLIKVRAEGRRKMYYINEDAEITLS